MERNPIKLTKNKSVTVFDDLPGDIQDYIILLTDSRLVSTKRVAQRTVNKRFANRQLSSYASLVRCMRANRICVEENLDPEQFVVRLTDLLIDTCVSKDVNGSYYRPFTMASYSNLGLYVYMHCRCKDSFACLFYEALKTTTVTMLHDNGLRGPQQEWVVYYIDRIFRELNNCFCLRDRNTARPIRPSVFIAVTDALVCKKSL